MPPLPLPPATNQSWNGKMIKILCHKLGGAGQFHPSNCDANVWICKDPGLHYQWWKRSKKFRTYIIAKSIKELEYLIFL